MKMNGYFKYGLLYKKRNMLDANWDMIGYNLEFTML